MHFYEKLAWFRKNAGLSQEILAKRLGVSRQAISKWEAGDTYPDPEKVISLCALLSCSADALLNPLTDAIADGNPPTVDGDSLVVDELCIGENVKLLRVGRGISQESFAERLGVSRQSVSKWETGLSLPKTETLIAMLPILDCSMDDLLAVRTVTFAPTSEEEACPQTERTHRRTKKLILAVTAAVLVVILLAGVALWLALRRPDSPSVNGGTGGETDTSEETNPESPEPPALSAWSGNADTSWYSSKYAELEISTPEQLAGLASLVNGGVESFRGKTVRLTADLDLNGSAQKWVPIGSDEATAFCGTFDGNGHTVRGAHVEKETDVGLFGIVQGGTVKNLTLVDCRFAGEEHVGSLCGRLISRAKELPASIENCTVKESEVNGDLETGGIVGEMSAEGGTVTLATCDFLGDLHGGLGVGGLCGAAYTDGSSAAVKIADCFNQGEIIPKRSFLPGDGTQLPSGYFGGILGQYASKNKGSLMLERCANEAAISRGVDSLDVGGIVGFVSNGGNCPAEIRESYHVGKLCAGSKNSRYVGGIAGRVQGYDVRIVQCYNAGELTAEYYCGGIVGYYTASGVTAQIRECVFVGKIRSTLGLIDESLMAGNWDRFGYYMSFGGIVGYSGGGVSGQNILRACYASGEINAQYKGGLVGQQKKGNAKWVDCFYWKDLSIGYAIYGVDLSRSGCGTFSPKPPDSEIFYTRLNWSGEHWDTTGEHPVLIRS